MKTFNKAILTAGITLAMGTGSAFAATFPDFTIDEGFVPGAAANTFVADKITGNYVEVATFTPTGVGTGTFDLSIQWSGGQFVANDGTTGLNTQLGGFGGSSYNLYTLFQGSGTFNTVGAATSFTFNNGGSLAMYLDPNSDTGFTQPIDGSLAWGTAPDDVEDILIATGAIISGSGVLDTSLATCAGGGINCGSFGTTASFALNDDGKQYFTAPNPFYTVSFESGQLNNFDVAGTQVINGSLDVVFEEVPEPASLALVGLGLFGMGFRNRKKV